MPPDLWLGTFLFGAIVISMRRMARLKSSASFVLALIWAAVYPIVQLPLVGAMPLPADWNVVGATLTASLISAGLLWGAARSPWPALGCLAGWGLTAFGQPIGFLLSLLHLEGGYWMLVLMWNGMVAASALGWAARQQRQAGSGARCGKCGYELKGLPAGAVCPECGVRRCASCGYDLKGLAADVCPECGSGAGVNR